MVISPPFLVDEDNKHLKIKKSCNTDKNVICWLYVCCHLLVKREDFCPVIFVIKLFSEQATHFKKGSAQRLQLKYNNDDQKQTLEIFYLCNKKTSLPLNWTLSILLTRSKLVRKYLFSKARNKNSNRKNHQRKSFSFDHSLKVHISSKQI